MAAFAVFLYNVHLLPLPIVKQLSPSILDPDEGCMLLVEPFRLRELPHLGLELYLFRPTNLHFVAAEQSSCRPAVWTTVSLEGILTPVRGLLVPSMAV